MKNTTADQRELRFAFLLCFAFGLALGFFLHAII